MQFEPYNALVREYFADTRHAGTLPDAISIAIDEQGVSVEMSASATEQTIKALRFRIRGCPHSVAACEAICRQLEGEKVERLERWMGDGETVLAVGDGINDAPLLGRAHVSAAMGSGSDLARLRADTVLLDDRLTAIPLALRWARRTRRVMHQNFAWALVYNGAVLPLAVVGALPPWLAALGMSASSLVVVANSTRLRKAPRVALGGPR